MRTPPSSRRTVGSVIIEAGKIRRKNMDSILDLGFLCEPAPESVLPSLADVTNVIARITLPSTFPLDVGKRMIISRDPSAWWGRREGYPESGFDALRAANKLLLGKWARPDHD